jgi:hypothetical protein
MPLTEVVEARAIISSALEKRVELLFVLCWVADEFSYRTAALLHRDFDDFERVSADVLRENETSCFAPAMPAKLLSYGFGNTSW